MESPAQLSQQHRSQTASLQSFNMSKRLPTCLPNSINMESTTTEGGRRPTGGGQRRWTLKKTTETEAR